ncbi:MAG: glycoside hydrolase family 18 protein [Ginsengibacter sp.]
MKIYLTKPYLLAFVALALFFQACKKETPSTPQLPETIKPPPPIGFVVAGYFPSYRSVAEYPDRMFRMCNVINYAFANITAANTVSISNTLRMDSVYKKGKANGAKIFLSISGDAGLFASMSNNAGGRNVFVKDLMQKVRQYNLDGIDIDWEYPRTTDGTSEFYRLLMKELSDSLHSGGKYYLSAAITPGLYSGSIRDGIKNEIFGYADFLNVMMYDDFTTDPSRLYQQHSPYEILPTSFNYWISRGLPSQKLVIGIPVYGRPSGMTQSGTALAYKTIILQGGNPQSDSAIVTAPGFSLYKIYYNGRQTVKKKAAYAKSFGGGIMFWEIGQDTNDDLSLIKAACDTIGRSY